ncbi:MAG TPA: hypothetical protein VD997_04325 [Phycisphaerales bacterium]|nr:hypothetical protein [Phycisphaerales bacterium]
MGKYAAAFQALPRAAKWAIFGLGLVLVYFGVVEPMLVQINQASMKADQHETLVRSFTEEGGTQKKAMQTLQAGIRNYGDVEYLGDEAGRTLKFNSDVDRILRENKVTGAKSSTKSVSLGQGVLTAKVGSDYRVLRIVRDIDFEATPEEVAAVVAGLERSPVVATVSRVQIRTIEGKQSERTVHATLTAEAWISVKKG